MVIHARHFAPDNYIAGWDEKIEAHDPIEFLSGKERSPRPLARPFWAEAPELKELIAGRISGRESAGEITCFVNNIGMGIQFAALGAAAYQEARAKGIGKEIPTDWFLQSVHP